MAYMNVSNKFESSELLKQHLENYKNFGEGLSLREWAKLCNLSPTYLSQILNSKRLASENALENLAKGIDLDKISLKNLKIARLRDFMRSKGLMHQERPNSVESNMEFNGLEVVVDSAILKSWLHFALLDFATCTDVNWDLDNLSKKFGCSKAILKVALNELIEARLLIKDESGILRKFSNHLRVPVPRSTQAVRDFHMGMILKAYETLKKSPWPTPEDVKNRLLISYTVAISPEKFDTACEILNDSVSRVLKELTSGDSSTVYQFQIQLLPLLKS